MNFYLINFPKVLQTLGPKQNQGKENKTVAGEEKEGSILEEAFQPGKERGVEVLKLFFYSSYESPFLCQELQG